MTEPRRPASATRSGPRRALRWAVRVVAAVLAFAVLGAGAAYAASEWRLRTRFDVPAHAFAAPNDAAAAGRGGRLARRDGCLDCHGEGLAGRVIVDDPAVGRFAGPNLTTGGRGPALDDRAWELAVRHAVRPDGRALLFMPAHEFSGMPDDELAAIVAYARSLPASPAPSPAPRVGPVARALFLKGDLALVPAERVSHGRAHAASIRPEPTAAYGAHMAAGCVGCHGPGYAGGAIPGAPPDWLPASNITPTGIGGWSEADLVRALRDGKRPDGSPIRPPMPIAATKVMTDVELAALWAYLRTLPPRATGTR